MTIRPTVRRLAAGALAATALTAASVTTAPSADAAKSTERRIVEVAHRGSSFEAPENTLAAVAEGISDKADMIEIDVQRSKDGVLVVIHDTDLRRTTDVEEVFPGRTAYPVKDFTWAELQRLDAGSWKGAEFTGERIPTFEQVIAMIDKSRSGLLVEAKAPELYPGISAQIADALAARPGFLKFMVAQDRLAVQSFNWDFMREFHGLLPQVPAGLLGKPTDAQLVEFATWADQINPSFGSVDAAYIARVHELGMVSFVWTVDKPADMERMVTIGVDGIISNKPDTLDQVLRSM